ncbi:hypothetical protein EDD72_10225 [Tepidibacillus fermentans]|uniref:Uncharacterized protein n=2 Tax=Tepidibacillus fermentans TaxID=1281767 RepID=A0A4R3KK51_9BACI|nr:hypothetical protein EDD72_10225 [Tepidibacillus fermentans]
MVETLWAIFIFSVILMSSIPIYRQMMIEREHRSQDYLALTIARSEMEVSQNRLQEKEYQRNIYHVQVYVQPYNFQILEIQVMVSWKQEEQKREISLKKLVYPGT